MPAKTPAARLNAIADVIDDVIYVADPETYELLYVNKAAEKFWGKNVVGKKCHKVLQDRDKPCPFCSNKEIFGENLGKTYIWEFQNEVTGYWFRCVDKAIEWVDGRMVRMELAGDINDRKVLEEDLRERVKELGCMQAVSNVIEQKGITIDKVVEETARALSTSLRFPKSTIARVTIDDDFHETGDFESCVDTMSAEIKLADKKAGSVEIGYHQKQPEADKGPFLSEERDLINFVAEMLGVFLSRQKAETELIEHQKYLEQEIDKRTAELQFRSSELTTIIDSIPGLVFYKDNDNRYVRVNQFVADAHKMKKEEIEGQSCWDLYPKDVAKAYYDDDMEVINSGKAKLNIDEPWDTEDGRRWVNTSKIPFLDESGKVVGLIGVSMDVTERKEAEEEIARQAKIRTAVNKFFREALACETIEDVVKSALAVAEKLTGSKFGFIGEVNEQGRFDTIGLSNPGWDSCNIQGSNATALIKNMELRGIWATVLKSGKSLIIDDPYSHPDSVGTPDGHPPLTSFLGVPLIREGRAVGVIALGNKDGNYTADDQEAVEVLSAAFYEVLIRKRAELQVKKQTLLKTSKTELSDIMRGDQTLNSLCRGIITHICKSLDAQTGLIFIGKSDGSVDLEAVYAHRRPGNLPKRYGPGEGLIGQAVLERKEVILENIPDDYIKIESGFGATKPKYLYIKPIVHNQAVKAVLEIGFLKGFDEFKLQVIDEASDSIAMAVESAQARSYQAKLLEESQQLSEELQAQQEELKTANEELEEQTQRPLCQ